ncbi:DNA gyrase subunit A [Candidatus Woesearchaeota archaeon]|nr:DNA gyrase subunit A [Candidatus Woesearchaeota archaeon]RLE42848.1 MAG: DNA gyrase subunit A [Candidatus Woesearchaeota archaeon]
MAEKHKIRLIEDEMRESYLDYSMSVIVSRALPDIRDGLKPVHRRILYAMYEMGLTPERPFKKSARVVGEVLGKFHPHGDQAVYDSLVRMAQEFSMRYPLVRGQGNFGSVDGDSPAAMRYTEVKLTKLAMEILENIHEDTVDFVPNFDNSLQEPVVLPSKVPNMLINGGSGIAVGMATNIPPHNLREVCRAITAYIDNPEISVEGIMDMMPGPDFPTGGIIYGNEGIKHAYMTGRGKIVVRGKTRVETDKSGEPNAIVVEEIPYMVNKTLLIEDITKCVKSGVIKQISGLNDESDREGMRLVIKLKRGSEPEVVLNQLYKHTRLQTTFGIIMLGLIDNRPKQLNLKGMFECFVNHRLTIIKRRTQYEYLKSKERLHILDGLKIALENIDAVIKLIKSAKSPKEAEIGLVESYQLSEKQARAILDMKLSKLTALEQEALEKEHKVLTERIKELEAILASKEKQLEIIKEELFLISEKYGDDRRTEIIEGDFGFSDIDYEDLIEEESVVVTLSNQGYIKRTLLEEYRSQGRGGKGITAGKLHEDDFMEHVFVASTHSYLLCFSNKGKVYWLKVYQIPEGSRIARGTHIRNLLNLEEDERINTVVPVKVFDPERYLTFVTRGGKVKRTSLEAYSRPRRVGIIAISLVNKDEVVCVLPTDGKGDIIIATANGKAIRFKETEVRVMGRNASGVRGIRLSKDDYVIGSVVAEEGKTLLTVTENGFGKRTRFEEYPTKHRGGKGVINIKTTKRNGRVVSIKSVSDDDEIMMVSTDGIAIRIRARDISVIGRNTQGVRLMRVNKGSRVASVGRVVELS